MRRSDTISLWLKQFTYALFLFSLLYNFVAHNPLLADSNRPKNSKTAPNYIVYKLKETVSSRVHYRGKAARSLRKASLRLSRVIRRRAAGKVRGTKKLVANIQKKRDQKIGLSRVLRQKTKAGTSPLRTCNEILKTKAVEYCQEDIVMTTTALPNDTYVSTSPHDSWSTGAWGQDFEDLWGLKMVEAVEAWDDSTCSDNCKGENVLVAVVDSGVDYTHPDIQRNIYVNPGEDINSDGVFDELDENGIDDDGNGFIDDGHGYDFSVCDEGIYYCNGVTKSEDSDPIDDNGHGTHVAGTIAAEADNGIGIAGVAPKAKILPIKALDEYGSGFTSALAKGLIYAADMGAKVINNSWGSGRRHRNDLIEDAVRYAYADGKGSLVVFAAGNWTDVADYYIPQNMNEVVSVAALRSDGKIADFSNYGDAVSIAAPGGGDDCPVQVGLYEDCPYYLAPSASILSLLASNATVSDEYPERIVGRQYLRQAGTSMAAPHVAGVAALIAGKNPNYKASQLQLALVGGAKPFDEEQELYIGKGVVNAKNSIDYNSPSAHLSGYDLNTSEPYLRKSSTASIVFHIATLNIEAPYTARLTTNDPRIRVRDGNATFNSEEDENFSSNVDDPFIFEYTGLGELLTDDISFTVEIDGTGISLKEIVRFEIKQKQGWPATPNRVAAKFGMPTLMDLDGDQKLEVIVNTYGSEKGLYVFEDDGSLKEGWPAELEGDGYYNEPVRVADIDGDGSPELFVLTHARIEAFHLDGTKVSGWPFTQEYLGGIAIGDLNNDGSAEIVTRNTLNENVVIVLNAHGELLDGYPKRIDTDWSGTAPVIADLDGNGTNEILIGGVDVGYVGRGNVLAFPLSGELHPGFPKVLDYYSARNFPTVGDLDGDGTLEIVAGQTPRLPEDGGFDPTLYAWHSDVNQGGKDNLVEGWPVEAVGANYTEQIIADLDGDGFKEIIAVETRRGIGEVVNVRNHRGETLPGFPITDCPTAVEPSLADIDGDGKLEIFIASFNAYICAYHLDGTKVSGFPIFVNNPYNTLTIGDVDNDGSMELVGSSFYETGATGELSVWTLPYLHNGNGAGWSTQRANMSRTGSYEREPSLPFKSYTLGPKLHCGENCGQQLPEIGTITVLESGGTLLDPTPTIRWEPVEGATHYNLLIQRNDSDSRDTVVRVTVSSPEFHVTESLHPVSTETNSYRFSISAWVPQYGWANNVESIIRYEAQIDDPQCAERPDVPLIDTTEHIQTQNPPKFELGEVDCADGYYVLLYNAETDQFVTSIYSDNPTVKGYRIIDPTLRYKWNTYAFGPGGGSDTSASGYFTVAPAPFQNLKEYRQNDVNDDGYVSAKDALAILEYLDGSPVREIPSEQSDPPLFFDTNGDNLISLEDIEPILQYHYPPSIFVSGSQSGVEGERLDFPIVAFPYIYEVDLITEMWADNLPEGASFNSETGVFSWIPTYEQAGTYPGVTFYASDGVITGSISVTLEVRDSPQVQPIGEVGLISRRNYYRPPTRPSFTASGAEAEEPSENFSFVKLEHDYDDVVVFIMPILQGEEDSAIPRIIETESENQEDFFKVAISEPSNLDGAHENSDLYAYIALEKGTWFIGDNDARLEVGKKDELISKLIKGAGTDDWSQFEIIGSFDKPLIISQLQKQVAPDLLYADIRITRGEGYSSSGEAYSSSSDQSYFLGALQLEEALTVDVPEHREANVGWMILDRGIGTWNGAKYFVSTRSLSTSRRSSSPWTIIDSISEAQFEYKPAIFGQTTTLNEDDSVHLRLYKNWYNSSFHVALQEDTTLDEEMSHRSEDVNYFAIELLDTSTPYILTGRPAE